MSSTSLNTPMSRQSVFITLVLLLSVNLVGCTSRQPTPPSATAAAGGTGGSSLFEANIPEPTATALAVAQIIVHADGPTRPFDQRLLGTNVAAWLGPELLANPEFQASTIALGTTLLRMPGGSWSNYYDWHGCEMRDEERCYWPWAARPSDFLAFARAVDAEIIWTVSPNGTAKEAAALVAFFNGSVDDETVIGVDGRGRDWQTVGHWARLRSENGSPEPLPVRLWEVGNEVYGGKPAAGGAECAAWGWEDVWTCDGAEYIAGKGEGAERHAGYLEFRNAMRAVDPSILVGAVGVEEPAEWSAWGNEVIAGAGEQLDFYVVHRYPFGNETPTTEQVLEQPQLIWPAMRTAVDAAYERYSAGRRAPIAVTEYNLVANQDLDDNQLMRRAVNALYTADTIGQLAEQGVSIANHWNLANGSAENGTDYGMIDVKTGVHSPQYYGMLLWQRFGSELLPVESAFTAATELSVYAGRTDDGTITVLAINKTDQPIEASLRIEGIEGVLEGTIDSVTADGLDAFEVSLNGMAGSATKLTDAPSQPLGRFEKTTMQTFEPFSITLLRLTQKR